MSAPQSTAGALLRIFRQRRNMTLRDAARHAGTSLSSLSRKERGVDTLHRDFLLRVVKGYQLNEWEAGELFDAAQVMRAPGAQQPPSGLLHDFLRDLLGPLPFPAAAVGSLGFVRAWNQALEETGLLAFDAGHRPHVLDAFLGAGARALCGAQWEEFAERALRTFWALTQNQALDPAFAALIERLDATYGAHFRAPWDRLLAAALDGGTLEGGAALVIAGGAAGGPYTVLHSTVQARVPLTLLLYVPTGAQGARHTAGGAPQQAVYFADTH